GVSAGPDEPPAFFEIHSEAPQFVAGDSYPDCAPPLRFAHFHRAITESDELSERPIYFVQDSFDNYLFSILGNFADGTINPAVEDIRIAQVLCFAFDVFFVGSTGEVKPHASAMSSSLKMPLYFAAERI